MANVTTSSLNVYSNSNLGSLTTFLNVGVGGNVLNVTTPSLPSGNTKSLCFQVSLTAMGINSTGCPYFVLRSGSATGTILCGSCTVRPPDTNNESASCKLFLPNASPSTTYYITSQNSFYSGTATGGFEGYLFGSVIFYTY